MWPLALLFLFGAGAARGEHELHNVERKAEASISRSLGGQGQIAVHITPNGPAGAWGDLEEFSVVGSHYKLDAMPLSIVKGARATGRIGNLRLRLSDFTLRSLRIAELDADIPACRFDFAKAKSQGSMDFARSGVGRGQVVINQGALADFILHKYKEIRACKVTVDRDVIIVEGRGDFVVATTDFTVISRIGCTEGTKLNLVGAHIFFGIQPADRFSSKALLKVLNPVVDLDKDLGLRDAVAVESITLRGGQVVASGRSRVPTRH